MKGKRLYDRTKKFKDLLDISVYTLNAAHWKLFQHVNESVGKEDLTGMLEKIKPKGFEQKGVAQDSVGTREELMRELQGLPPISAENDAKKMPCMPKKSTAPQPAYHGTRDELITELQAQITNQPINTVKIKPAVPTPSSLLKKPEPQPDAAGTRDDLLAELQCTPSTTQINTGVLKLAGLTKKISIAKPKFPQGLTLAKERTIEGLRLNMTRSISEMRPPENLTSIYREPTRNLMDFDNNIWSPDKYDNK